MRKGLCTCEHQATPALHVPMTLLQPGQGGQASDIGSITQAPAALLKVAGLAQAAVGADGPVSFDRCGC